MATGALRVEDLVTDRLSPEAFNAAYTGLLDRPAEHLAVVVDWRGSR
jgi:threonine dehydrogenase-like Zn-dependent dehydrogenase